MPDEKKADHNTVVWFLTDGPTLSWGRSERPPELYEGSTVVDYLLIRKYAHCLNFRNASSLWLHWYWPQTQKGFRRAKVHQSRLITTCAQTGDPVLLCSFGVDISIRWFDKILSRPALTGELNALLGRLKQTQDPRMRHLLSDIKALRADYADRDKFEAQLIAERKKTL